MCNYIALLSLIDALHHAEEYMPPHRLLQLRFELFLSLLPTIYPTMKSYVAILFWLAAAEAIPFGDGQHKPTALDWTPCDLELGLKSNTSRTPADCVKLEVPLDYSDPNSGQLQLQLLKVNATKKPSKGSVLFNPGGPGGSGVELVAIGAPIFDRYVLAQL